MNDIEQILRNMEDDVIDILYEESKSEKELLAEATTAKIQRLGMIGKMFVLVNQIIEMGAVIGENMTRSASNPEAQRVLTRRMLETQLQRDLETLRSQMESINNKWAQLSSDLEELPDTSEAENTSSSFETDQI